MTFIIVLLRIIVLSCVFYKIYLLQFIFCIESIQLISIFHWGKASDYVANQKWNIEAQVIKKQILERRVSISDCVIEIQFYNF
jgi:hypothetical protein